MRIRVLKFGGSSLANRQGRAAALSIVRSALSEGVWPVVVVSALGRRGDPYATDTLLALVRGSDVEPTPRELALLGSCGEVIAAVVVSAVLRRAGIPAVAMTGAQAGIRTVHGYAGAVILSLDPGGMLESLHAGRVPVVTGFQGATPAGDVAILQRGGSDISGTALGYALRAERVDIYTDVPGVMTADPRLVPEARTIPMLGFREALLLARAGARVVHPQALRWAMRGPLPVHIRSTFAAGEFTRIGEQPADTAPGLLGIAARTLGEDDRSILSVVGTDGALDDPSFPGLLHDSLAAAAVPVLDFDPAGGVLAATVPGAAAARGARVLHALFLGQRREALAGVGS
jgi:aspartate kinase